MHAYCHASTLGFRIAFQTLRQQEQHAGLHRCMGGALQVQLLGSRASEGKAEPLEG